MNIRTMCYTLLIEVMSMNPYEIEKLVQNIRTAVMDNHLCKATLLNKSDFIFSLSRERKRKLFISLNNQHPFLTLAEMPSSFPTLASPFHTLLKHELDDGLILDIASQPNDRIVTLKIEKVTDAYKTLHRHWIIELISNHPNMILTDEQGLILGVYKPSSSLEDKRPLLKGLHYHYPEPLSAHTYPESALSLQGLFDAYEKVAFEGHAKEKYKAMFAYVKARIDSLKKKQLKLTEDYNKARSKMIDKDKGNALLSSIGTLEEGTPRLIFEGMEIALNPQWSLSDNANAYFKSYRKAKNAQLKVLEQQALANEELAYLEAIYDTMGSLGDEDLEDIALELQAIGFELTPTKGRKLPKVKAIHPYFLMHEGVKVGFGKNNLQNDYLTFKLAKSSHWFFHVKNDHGSHVIIFDDHPSDELKTLASEIALMLSKKSDGEVLMAPKSSIKKGNRPGLVKLDKYQSFYIKKVRNQTLEKMKEAQR